MTLVADILTTLPFLQAEAEGRMVDACTITRGGGATTFDPNTGGYTDPDGSTIYTGKCEVQIGNGLNSRETEAGGTELTVTRLTVKVPISAEGIREGDLVTITAAALDPDLVDAEYRVVAGFAKTFATCRRIQVERT